MYVQCIHMYMYYTNITSFKDVSESLIYHKLDGYFSTFVTKPSQGLTQGCSTFLNLLGERK